MARRCTAMSGATARTAHIPMPVLRTVFPGRIVSRFADIKRSARSPDVASVPDYFKWGYVRSKVNETRPANNDIIQRIREYIQATPKEMPQRVMSSLPSRVQECTDRNSGHILLLPLALQPTVGFGLSNKILPFFPICHQLSPSSLNLSSFFLCSTFVTISFLLCGVVSPTPNPHPGGPGYPFLSYEASDSKSNK
jgi:hypothetical protein